MIKDLRTGERVKIECYKCGCKSQLLVEEKRNNDTGELVEKNFICAKCAKLFQHE
jgi:hypothetical protein